MTVSAATSQQPEGLAAFVEWDGFAGKDEGRCRHGRAGVAVFQRMEEQDVEVGPGGA